MTEESKKKSETVEYFVLCLYCGEPYSLMYTPVGKMDFEDWQSIQKLIGTRMGKCDSCVSKTAWRYMP